jgi:hypothetical protein
MERRCHNVDRGPQRYRVKGFAGEETDSELRSSLAGKGDRVGKKLEEGIKNEHSCNMADFRSPSRAARRIDQFKDLVALRLSILGVKS